MLRTYLSKNIKFSKKHSWHKLLNKTTLQDMMYKTCCSILAFDTLDLLWFFILYTFFPLWFTT